LGKTIVVQKKKMTISDIKRGVMIVVEDAPFLVLTSKHSHVGRGGANTQTRIKNLRTGKVLERSFRSSDKVVEANIEKHDGVFIYEKNGEYWFHEAGDKSKRFSLSKDVIGEQTQYLLPQMEVTAFHFVNDGEEEIINIDIPIKVDYKVVEAPPSIKGNTVSTGNKVVTIESGAKVSTPLFIETGEIIRVNTETGEYVERV